MLRQSQVFSVEMIYSENVCSNKVFDLSLNISRLRKMNHAVDSKDAQASHSYYTCANTFQGALNKRTDSHRFTLQHILNLC